MKNKKERKKERERERERIIWKEFFEDLYNIDTQVQVAVQMCGFDGVRRSNYFEGEQSRKTEVEVREGEA